MSFLYVGFFALCCSNLFPQESLKALHIKVIHKVTLSLDLLSPPIPSFSGLHKVRNEKTQIITKCVGKTIVWVPVISLCKIFIPSYTI
jgi:hypothetical protein